MSMTEQRLKEIPFTQYLYPQGVSSLQFIDRPEEIANLAYDVIANGYRFAVENRYGKIVMACEPKGARASWIKEGQGFPWAIAEEKAKNGPEVIAAVDRLIKRAYEHVMNTGGAS